LARRAAPPLPAYQTPHRAHTPRTFCCLKFQNKQIPGLGKPITAVDVTYDGGYILATTDDYIMVVKTTFTDPTSGK
jgi:hypothetical protein